MTGQGHASKQSQLGTMTVEVRTVNNRGFKCSPRISDTLASLESRIESLARNLIHRGSVHLTVNWRRPPNESLPNIDTSVLAAYFEQLDTTRKNIGSEANIDLTALMKHVTSPVTPPVPKANEEATRQIMNIHAVQEVHHEKVVK